MVPGAYVVSVVGHNAHYVAPKERVPPPWRPSGNTRVQRRERLEPFVVLTLPQQPGGQVPHPGTGSPRPVPFVVVAQQYPGYRQTDQLRVGDRWRPTHPAAFATCTEFPVNDLVLC
jgi:hypothetical protein